MSWTRVGIYIGGSLGVFLTFFTAGGVLSYIFRKLFADFGQRWGPNRAGPGGIFQFLADGIKLIFKEDIIPTRVEEWGVRIAPYIAFVPPVIALSPIPFGRGLLLTDVRVGLILIFALAALATAAGGTAAQSTQGDILISGLGAQPTVHRFERTGSTIRYHPALMTRALLGRIPGNTNARPYVR
ncbi:MAG: NADH-quinone oxidoreductase subunit H, partial [Candidatus Bipolaricaulia bacterium]